MEEGDLISIDIPKRSISLLVDEAVLAERRKRWSAPPCKIQGGYLSRYAAHVSSAASGAIIEQ